MVNLSENAKKNLDNYLSQVRTCLGGCKSVDPDEVEQNIKEHIESELQDSSEPISCDVLDAVLQKLGSPQQWVPEEEISSWRKIISRLCSGPEDWRLAYLSFGLLLLSFLVGRQMPFFAVFLWPFIIFRGTSNVVLLLTSFCVSRAVLTVTPDRDKLGGQKWLIYPSLVVVYLPIFIILLLWPVSLLFEITQGYDHAKIDIFPWNTGSETPYWTLAFILFAGATFLWWLILALIHKKSPQLLGAIFRPFVQTIKPTILKRFMVIMAGLAAICVFTVIIMIKYQGWSAYFIKILG